jgi:hypothetical protein
MTPPRALSLRAFQRRGRHHWSALLAFALFTLGGSAHLIHHLTDPDCDGGPGPASHVCSSCASLHAGAMVEGIQAIVTQRPEWTRVDAPRLATPQIRFARTLGVPRAPPSV